MTVVLLPETLRSQSAQDSAITGAPANTRVNATVRTGAARAPFASVLTVRPARYAQR